MKADTTNVPHELSLIITIIINSVTCPFTVLLNVLVIMAVKRRPRLQSNANILLACLAVTDALTGLTTQPSLILLNLFQLRGKTYNDHDIVPGVDFHNSFFRALCVCSSLHLMLVTGERLIAIKFTMQYPYMVTKRNIKVAAISFWIFAFCFEILRQLVNAALFFNLLIPLVLICCVIFVVSADVILYRETLRHQEMIKAQQLPQEEVERFVKERKALKTTVYVIGAVSFCFLPTAFTVLAFASGMDVNSAAPWVRTFAMLNSFLNPLIYCWRQKEVRKFVFRISSPAIVPAN